MVKDELACILLADSIFEFRDALRRHFTKGQRVTKEVDEVAGILEAFIAQDFRAVRILLARHAYYRAFPN